MKYFLFLFIPVLIFQTSCKKESNSSYCNSITCNDADDSLNTYSLKIGAIFNANCVRSGCHNSGTHKAKIDLEGYDNAVASFKKKAVLNAIYHGKHSKPMPKGGEKLSDDAIHDITCWVKNEYPK